MSLQSQMAVLLKKYCKQADPTWVRSKFMLLKQYDDESLEDQDQDQVQDQVLLRGVAVIAKLKGESPCVFLQIATEDRKLVHLAEVVLLFSEQARARLLKRYRRLHSSLGRQSFQWSASASMT